MKSQSGQSRKAWVADFETTTTADDCRVWVWGVCLVEAPGNFHWGEDIASFIGFCGRGRDSVIYFHNLAFDGSFIMDYIMKNGWEYVAEHPKGMQFSTLISGMGKFYSITIVMENGTKIEFRDSLKKLPMGVSRIAQAFKLPEGKGDIDYHAHRPIGYVPTDDEIDYLRRDVQIIACALKMQFDEGMTKLTVGSDSLSEYKKLTTKNKFDKVFPVLAPEMDKQIRQAYRGGFTYADKRFKTMMLGEGRVYDVNSLYPYIMYDRLLPYGVPVFEEGLPKATKLHPLFIVSITFTAKLKPGRIPVIQVKNSRFLMDTEYLDEISDVVTMSATNVDLELWQKHYDMEIHSYNGGWKFQGMVGFFKDYIDKWMEIKVNSEGGMREIAKLHLNSLYGKFATNPDITGKYPVLEDEVVRLKLGPADTRNPVYTAMGVFITAYARSYTIEAAQANFDRFAYADTDSLHLIGLEEPVGIHVHKSDLGAWKHEYDFSKALYIRAKAYAEQIQGGPKDGQMETHIAGLPEVITQQITFASLVHGKVFEGKLSPKRVPGGVVLQDVGFTLKF